MIHAAEFCCCIDDRVVLQGQQAAEFVAVQLCLSLCHALREHEIDERHQFCIVVRQDGGASRGHPLCPRDRRQREGDKCQHIEHIALLGADHRFDLRELRRALAFVGKAVQQPLARGRQAPDAPQFVPVIDFGVGL